MSSRALRKLKRGEQKEGGDVPDDQDPAGPSPDDSKVVGGARAKMFNPFDLLNNDSCSESEVKEDDDLGTESSRSREVSVQLSEARNKKRKKTKNRKRGGKISYPVKSSEDNLEEFGDEVERSVSEVNRLLGPTDDSSSRRSKHPSESKVGGVQKTLLSVEPKNLNPENEMKKIFGSRVVLAEQRHQHNARRGSRVRAHARHNHWLVVPKPSWPNPGKTGLSMKFLESDDAGNQHFTFEHSQQYQAVQRQFFQAVESMHPDSIVQILNSNPFHIDSMLQLSEICKMGEDTQMATELIERTLYAMEAAFHPMFNLSTGTCRLDYRRQENRAFFLALFRHMIYVGSRACYRTALELCKLILSLDPLEDPLAVLLVVDFYALRANQHSWLIDLSEQWEPTRNLSQLPNFAYSVALARFHHSRVKEHKEVEGKRERLTEEADAAMREALVMFPGVLLQLLDRCSIEPDKRAAGHRFFLDQPSAKGLAILTSLYAGRSFHVWKEPDVLPWLEKNVNAVLDLVDSGSSELVASCAEKRKVRYQGTPRNIHRHVIVSEVKDASSELPRELSETPILSYDPLPPTDSINTYSSPGGLLGGTDGPASNLLRMFFSSLLPNFNVGDPAHRAGGAAEGGDEPAGAAGGIEQPGDLRRSVTTLLDAMHELLGGLHLPELPNDGAASADSENDGDED